MLGRFEDSPQPIVSMEDMCSAKLRSVILATFILPPPVVSIRPISFGPGEGRRWDCLQAPVPQPLRGDDEDGRDVDSYGVGREVWKQLDGELAEATPPRVRYTNEHTSVRPLLR